MRTMTLRSSAICSATVSGNRRISLTAASVPLCFLGNRLDLFRNDPHRLDRALHAARDFAGCRGLLFGRGGDRLGDALDRRYPVHHLADHLHRILGGALDAADGCGRFPRWMGGLVASALTSLATTAKPVPASPARAASIVAFSASRLVRPAMSPISRATAPIWPIEADSVIDDPVRLFAGLRGAGDFGGGDGDLAGDFPGRGRQFFSCGRDDLDSCSSASLLAPVGGRRRRPACARQRRRVPPPGCQHHAALGGSVRRRSWFRARYCRRHRAGPALSRLRCAGAPARVPRRPWRSVASLRGTRRRRGRRRRFHRGGRPGGGDVVLQIAGGKAVDDARQARPAGATGLRPTRTPTPRARPMATAIWIRIMCVLRVASSSASSRVSRPSAANFFTSLVSDLSACVIRSVSSGAGASAKAASSPRVCLPASRVRSDAARSSATSSSSSTFCQIGSCSADVLPDACWLASSRRNSSCA